MRGGSKLRRPIPRVFNVHSVHAGRAGEGFAKQTLGFECVHAVWHVVVGPALLNSRGVRVCWDYGTLVSGTWITI